MQPDYVVIVSGLPRSLLAVRGFSSASGRRVPGVCFGSSAEMTLPRVLALPAPPQKLLAYLSQIRFFALP